MNIKEANAEAYDKHNKPDLLDEVERRIKIGSPNFGEIKGDTLKGDIIAALVLDDEHTAAKPQDTPEAKSGGKAVKIPVVSKAELPRIEAHNPPADDQFTSYARRDSDKQLYAVAVHTPDTYGRTHTCKNSQDYWDGSEAQFRLQFKPEAAPKD